MFHEEKQRREKDKLIQLEKIEEEDFKYKIQ
jgi:hypothetical protein